MSDGQGHSGNNKPTDDRTLLDPLSTDELKALREARQRMKEKKEGAVAHQIVIGPDQGEDIGDAPTRAMPALPSFEGNVSIDQIGTNPPFHADPAERQTGGPPSEPMSMHGQHPGAAGVPPGVPGQPPGGKAGQTGFGENTLLWMQPPKPPPGVMVGGAATPDVLPKTSKKEVAKSRIRMFGIGLLGIVIGGGLLFSLVSPKARGVLELHTNPPKAVVIIDGKESREVTPVKLTLPAGTHSIQLRLESHEENTFVVDIKGESEIRKDVELMPISKPGLLTVSVAVQPVSANIVFDDVSHSGRSFKRANVDPKTSHKITIEAGGYVKITQDIAPGALKSDYSFVLQKDDSVPQ